MKPILSCLLGIAVAGSIAGCADNSISANTDTADQRRTPGWQPATAPKIMIPAGTALEISVIDGLGSTKSLRGDLFMASLSEPVVIGGKTVLDKGTRLRGRVVAVNKPGISLVLTDLIRNGKVIHVSTRTLSAVADPQHSHLTFTLSSPLEI